MLPELIEGTKAPATTAHRGYPRTCYQSSQRISKNMLLQCMAIVDTQVHRGKATKKLLAKRSTEIKMDSRLGFKNS